MSVPQRKLGQLQDEPQFENCFVEHFYTSQNIVPLGYVVLRLFDEMTTLASLYPQIPKIIRNGTNAKYQEDFLYLCGKRSRNVLGIQSKICIVVAPYETTLHDVQCDYLLIIGGKKVHIKNSNINSLFIYGTEQVIVENVTIIDTFIDISNTLEMRGDYFHCDLNYITVKNLITNNIDIVKDAFYLLGLTNVNLNKTSPKMLEQFPNMYLCSMEYSNKIVVFKLSPTMIHLRFMWLIWAMWNVDHFDIDITQSHLTLLESKSINNSPNYLRMSRYLHERNPYYQYFYNKMVSINMHLSDSEINIFEESTNRCNTTSFDLVPQIFTSRVDSSIKSKYLIKSV